MSESNSSNKRPLRSLLVTGGAGFIGSAFIRMCLEKESVERIVSYDLLTYAGNRDNVKTDDPRYRLVQGDILDAELVERILQEEKIDAIVHFAAETHVDRSIAGSRRFVETNVLGTHVLLEAVRKFPGVHFHHVSTDEVYGSLGNVGTFSEESPYRPNSPYAASKAASDHLVRSFTKTYGLSTTMSHCSNNYGPCQYPEKLIPLMISKALKGESLPVYGRGNEIREWLYVEDHVEAIWAILERGRAGEVYDIGGNAERTNLEIVHLLLEMLGKGRELIQFVPNRAGHDFRYALSSEKIAKELGWCAKTSLEEGLRKTIAWYEVSV